MTSSKLAGIQACLDLASTFNTNWNPANTGGITPQYRFNWELKWQWRTEGTDLVIFDYTETAAPTLYALDYIHDIALSIECYTAGFVPPPLGSSPGTAGTTTAHIQNMGDEAARIIKANPRLSGYGMLYVIASRLVPQDDRASFSIFLDCLLKKTDP